MLSETAVSELMKLTYHPDAEWRVVVLPFGSVYWADEMPDIRELVRCMDADRRQILLMFSIRLKLWDGEALSDDESQLWETTRNQVPTWPLFRRLKLTDEQKLARQKAERRVAEEAES